MWSKIGKIPLKTGEMMEIHMVKAPDDYYEKSIMSFLAPNKRIWLWHLKSAFRGELDELESRFYLGLMKGKVIGNASTWEYNSIGIVGHLLTVKDYRRKGVCTALMTVLIQDFSSRDGKILIGGFKKSSYPIAEKLGFRSITNNCEVMRYDLSPDFQKKHFQAKKVFCREPLWKDWPSVSLLFTVKEGWYLRSMRHKIFGPFDYEDFYLQDMRDRLKGLCKSKVLVTERGGAVGYATLAFKHHSNGNFWLLDFFAHPSSVSYATNMLETFCFPKGKIRCYFEADCREKFDILIARGFQKKRMLKKQIKRDGKMLKIIVMEHLKQ